MHALTAIRERELERSWIERTIGEPEWRQPDPSDPAVTRFYRPVPERGGRILRVACVESAGEIRILSAYFDRGARKPA
jgi:hypothetical protein